MTNWHGEIEAWSRGRKNNLTTAGTSNTVFPDIEIESEAEPEAVKSMDAIV
jgi:hypothetical protein